MSEWNDQAGRLREALVNFIWDQWIALGVAGRGSGSPVPFVVDPEALLLATMRFGSTEVRVVEEVLDWLARNGGLISLQRLKNLQVGSRLGTREGLEGLGHFMQDAGYRNWKSLPVGADKVSSRSGQGWVPEEVTLRGMSRVPDCHRPETFLLRLRALFGVNARPEVIAWLLTHSSGYAAEIARDTGWFSKSVQAILNDLELSGFVVSESEGKRKVYSVNGRSETFHQRFGFGFPWRSQAPLYLGMLHTTETLQRLAAAPKASEGAQSISIRKNLAAMNAAFRLAGTGNPFKATSTLAGEHLVEAFEEGVERMIEGIEQRAFG